MPPAGKDLDPFLPVLNAPPPPRSGNDPKGGFDPAINARPSLGCRSQAPPTLPSLEFPTISAPPAARVTEASTTISSSRRSPMAARAGPRRLASATPGRPSLAPSLPRCTRCTPASPESPRAGGPADRPSSGNKPRCAASHLLPTFTSWQRSHGPWGRGLGREPGSGLPRPKGGPGPRAGRGGAGSRAGSGACPGSASLGSAGYRFLRLPPISDPRKFSGVTCVSQLWYLCTYESHRSRKK